MKFHIYKDYKGEGRFRLKAANGKILADSGESDKTKEACRSGVDLVKGAATSPVVEDD